MISLVKTPQQAKYYITEGFYYLGESSFGWVFTDSEDEAKAFAEAANTKDTGLMVLCVQYPELAWWFKQQITQRLFGIKSAPPPSS